MLCLYFLLQSIEKGHRENQILKSEIWVRFKVSAVKHFSCHCEFPGENGNTDCQGKCIFVSLSSKQKLDVISYPKYSRFTIWEETPTEKKVLNTSANCRSITKT